MTQAPDLRIWTRPVGKNHPTNSIELLTKCLSLYQNGNRKLLFYFNHILTPSLRKERKFSSRILATLPPDVHLFPVVSYKLANCDSPFQLGKVFIVVIFRLYGICETPTSQFSATNTIEMDGRYMCVWTWALYFKTLNQ